MSPLSPHLMSITPELITNLIGPFGLAALVGTAVLGKVSLDRVAALKDKVEDRIETRLSQMETALSYVKGKLDGLQSILADGVITPTEAEQIKTNVAQIKDDISGIMGEK